MGSKIVKNIYKTGWAIGYFIVEYEQGGKDRAEYGTNLMENLEKSIDEKGMNVTLFKACRQFYQVYPQIRSTVSNEFGLLVDNQKSSTVSNEFITKPELLVKNKPPLHSPVAVRNQ